MTLLAFDDTDAPSGGCTTHLAWRIAASLPRGVDLVGPARLVRLNPNVPHKTRGNGALALRLGRGTGPPEWAGTAEGRTIRRFPAGRPLTASQREAVWAVARRVLEEGAVREDERTQPAMVMTDQPLPEAWYRAAVSRYVSTKEALTHLDAAGARWFSWDDGRGLRGASAAAAWPMRLGTYELLAYRRPDRVGTPRDLDPRLGTVLDGLPGTFDNWDPETGHLRVAPAGPDPILVGVRGTDLGALRRALDHAGPEAPEGALLVATNQATDDHAVPRAAAEMTPFSCATLEGRLVQDPVTWRGGHVFARFADASGTLDVAAFAPTGPIGRALATLRAGDSVRVQGGVHQDPTLLALERLAVIATVPRGSRLAPGCPSCRRQMKSQGRGGIHRCPGCGTRAPAVEMFSQGPPAATFDAPTRVRRHLCRPPSLRRLVEWAPSGPGPDKVYQVAAA